MSCCLLLVLVSASALSGDWYVDANDPGCASGTGGPTAPFCELFTAIQAAAPGDTIHVAPGDYMEVVVDRDLTIFGTSGSAVTTIRASAVGFPVVEVISGVTAVLVGFTIQDGYANDPYYGYGSGGGVYNDGTLTLSDAVITANRGSVAGGGILNLGTLTLSDAVVSANYAGSLIGFGMNNGGGLQNLGTATLTEVTVVDNGAADSGGGIDNDGTLTLYDCDIDDNWSVGSSGYGVDAAGGGIYNTGTLTAEDTLIRRNATDSNNYSGYDGGGGLANIGGVVVLTRCTVEENEVDGWDSDGGGILNLGSKTADLTLNECFVLRNTVDCYYAATGGGGIYSRATLLANRCTIAGNTADAGGGVFDASGYQGTLVGCVIQGNKATFSSSGGLYAGGTTVDHCTIAGNSAKLSGGGLVAGSGATFTHTIVASNTAPAGPDIYGSIDSLGYNLIGDTSDCTITGDLTGNLLDVSPQFIGSSRRLSSSSPCIDAGDPARTTSGTDLDRIPRWLDGNLDGVQVVDMGACEFDHVNLAVTGSTTPGGTMTFTSTGTAGLKLYLFVSTGVNELAFPHFGALFPDLAATWDLVSLGALPDTRSFVVPPSLPTPFPLVLQEVAIQGSGIGNTSNLVTLTIQ